MPGSRLSTTKSTPLVALLVYAGLVAAIYINLTPPLFPAARASHLPIFGLLPGDLPGYSLRFAITFLLLGVGSLILARVLGLSWRQLGIVRARDFTRSPLFLLLILAAVIIGTASAYSANLSTYYPYSHTLLRMAVTKSWLYLPLHLICYIVFYYVPWEIFFRGLLVVPFVAFLADNDFASPAAFVVACFQVLPSAMLHVGHPFSEMAGAVFFGVVAAWLVCRTRSIVPGLIFHATVGVVLDTAIFLRALDVLPGGTPGLS